MPGLAAGLAEGEARGARGAPAAEPRPGTHGCGALRLPAHPAEPPLRDWVPGCGRKFRGSSPSSSPEPSAPCLGGVGTGCRIPGSLRGKGFAFSPKCFTLDPRGHGLLGLDPQLLIPRVSLPREMMLLFRLSPPQEETRSPLPSPSHLPSVRSPLLALSA